MPFCFLRGKEDFVNNSSCPMTLIMRKWDLWVMSWKVSTEIFSRLQHIWSVLFLGFKLRFVILAFSWFVSDMAGYAGRELTSGKDRENVTDPSWEQYFRRQESLSWYKGLFTWYKGNFTSFNNTILAKLFHKQAQLAGWRGRRAIACTFSQFSIVKCNVARTARIRVSTRRTPRDSLLAGSITRFQLR